MQYKDVTLKNIHTLPLAGIAFHRVNSSECRLLEYENDTVIRIEYENINGGIYEDVYLAERN